MCGNELYSIILQLIATICSGISSLGIVNPFNIQNIKIRVYIITISAGLQLLVQLIKLHIANRRHSDPNDPRDCIHKMALWQIPSVNTKQKALIIGVIDCAFDVISALSLLYGVDFQNADITSYLITLGTLIGFSEEMMELILEIILIFIDYISDRDDNKKLQFHIISCLGTIELMVAFVEISISAHIIWNLNIENSDVDLGMKIGMGLLMFFIAMFGCIYVNNTHPRCCWYVGTKIVGKEFAQKYNKRDIENVNLDEDETIINIDDDQL